MKKKKLPGKLSLCRETLNELTSTVLEKAAGGRSEGSWCPSCESCTGVCCTSFPPP